MYCGVGGGCYDSSHRSHYALPTTATGARGGVEWPVAANSSPRKQGAHRSLRNQLPAIIPSMVRRPNAPAEAAVGPMPTALEWATSQHGNECGGATKNHPHRLPLQTLNVLRPSAAAAADLSARETVVWQGANIARGPSLLLTHRSAATVKTTAAAVVRAPTVASPPDRKSVV